MALRDGCATIQTEAYMSDRLLTMADLTQRYCQQNGRPCARLTVYRRIARGELPPPDLKLGGKKGVNFWYQSTIEQNEKRLAQKLKAERDAMREVG